MTSSWDCPCRYLNYHKLDLTLHQLIDQMASPLAKDSLAEWTFREVDTWPTPQDYIHMLATGTRYENPTESLLKKVSSRY